MLAGVVTAAVLAAGCAPEVPLTSFPVGGGPAVVTTVPPDTVGPLRMRGGDLVDATGRVVLLHGINSVAKSAPFISTLDAGGLGPAERAYLVGNGLNAVRLGVSYAALMPTPGDIDEAYLDTVVAQLAAGRPVTALGFSQGQQDAWSKQISRWIAMYEIVMPARDGDE